MGLMSILRSEPLDCFLGYAGLSSPGNGDSDLVLSSKGSTAEIQHDVYVNGHGNGALNVLIDDSAGLVAHNATLNQSTIRQSPQLKGFSSSNGEASLYGVGRNVVYKTPRGLNNSLHIDLGRGAGCPGE
jgi:hypothetical protein